MLEKIKKVLEEKYPEIDFKVKASEIETYKWYQSRDERENHEITITVPEKGYDGLFESIGYEVCVLAGELEGERPLLEEAEQAGRDFEAAMQQ